MNITEHIEHKLDFSGLPVIVKTLTLHGIKWRYSICGTGPKYLLTILSNTTGHLFAVPFAEAFSDRYTVIGLSVPAGPSFLQTADGLAAVLQHENAGVCDAIGHSNGGVYIQNLYTWYPELLDKMIFSHSLTSMDESDARTTNDTEVRIYNMTKILLKFLPASVLGHLMGAKVLKKLVLESGREDTRRLYDLCREDVACVTKADFYALCDRMLDFLFHHTFQSEVFKKKAGDILVIDSPSDHLANPRQRAKMLELCPGCHEYHLKKGGHVSMLTCKDEYFTAIRKFWEPGDHETA